MKLTREQQLELKLIGTQIQLNETMNQNLMYASRELLAKRQALADKWANEAREKEDKPEEDFDCNLNLDTFEFVFTEKEKKDA